MKNKTKTVLFASLIMAMILPFSVMGMAETQPNENANEKAKEMTKKEKQKKQDEIGKTILEMKIKNQNLDKIKSDTAREKVSTNNKNIEKLFGEMKSITPDIELVEISELDMAKMETAIYKLISSGLPIYEMDVNDSTGLLDIGIDLERSENEITEKDVRKIIGGSVKINLYSGYQDAYLQGACSGQSGICNPVIGGSFAEDDNIAQDCTLTIADKKGSVNGMIMPHHCNPNHADMWQAKKGQTNHELGSLNTHGGWLCDCDFVKSDSRSIDENLLN